jgi:trehalose 6-phosphate phosphatase
VLVVTQDQPDLLAPLRRDPSSSAIFSDFDGTLAPIVADPAAAVAVPGVPELLGELAGHYRTVAIISGRPVSFLSPQLPPSVVVVGLYGLEVRRDGEVQVDPGAERWRPVIADAVQRSEADGPEGMGVESKGLSLTLHYRVVPEAEARVHELAEEIAAGSGLVVRSARQSVELHPPVEADKGSALLALAADLGAACYLGDDVGDLAAFSALDTLRAGGTSVAKVAVGSDEAPQALLGAADVVVDGPPAAAALLRSLLP